MEIFPVSGWLKSRGITQLEVADLLQINKSTVSRKLHGHSQFNVREISLLNQHFGIPLEVFMKTQQRDDPQNVS